MAMQPVPISEPEWLRHAYFTLRNLMDHPLFPWARLALDSDWQHLEACVDVGMSPYESWPEAMTVVYDAVVLSEPMMLAFPGAQQLGLATIQCTSSHARADRDYRYKLFTSSFDYKRFPCNNLRRRCSVCRAQQLNSETGWHQGVIGVSACEPCSKRVHTQMMHSVNRYGRPVPLPQLADAALEAV